MDCVVRQLMIGLRDRSSALHLLRPIARHIFPMIMSYVRAFNEEHIAVDDLMQDDVSYHRTKGQMSVLKLDTSLPTVPRVDEQRLINVNMLPVRLGDSESFPKQLRKYSDFVRKLCAHVGANELVYLTVQESFVKKGDTQRRPGLHVETPVSMVQHGSLRCNPLNTMRWGGGGSGVTWSIDGGIVFVSNQAYSTSVYHCRIRNPEEIVGPHGSVEHLRSAIEKLSEVSFPYDGEAIWITDLTPHEALPADKDYLRVFVRVVTSDVSVWYSDHNTPNPNVKVPATAKTVKGDKFKAAKDAELAGPCFFCNAPYATVICDVCNNQYCCCAHLHLDKSCPSKKK